MPAIVAYLGAMLISLARVWAVSIIGRILVAFGLSFVAYKVAVPDINAFVAARFSGLPSFVRESVGAAGVDIFMSMVLSALAVKVAAKVALARTPS